MDARDEYQRIINAMTPAQRLEAAARLYWGARELKAAWLRQQHPEWAEEQVQKVRARRVSVCPRLIHSRIATGGALPGPNRLVHVEHETLR
ncbi:MAG: hypothetical protein FJY92_00370 [Candidatus Hydrogenedentes bacterium]|nr:hypothetical protein [Candidatus Hydrogenedentota bacterium]